MDKKLNTKIQDFEKYVNEILTTDDYTSEDLKPKVWSRISNTQAQKRTIFGKQLWLYLASGTFALLLALGTFLVLTERLNYQSHIINPEIAHNEQTSTEPNKDAVAYDSSIVVEEISGTINDIQTTIDNLDYKEDFAADFNF